MADNKLQILEREQHWDAIFKTADYTQVLWHQASPEKSVELIERYATKDAKILDAGCGASFLVDRLLRHGYKEITLLDTSKTSLDIINERVNSEELEFVCSDILNFSTEQMFDIWHDRAVFHFLLNKKEREAYFNVLQDSLKSGGTAIISTFKVGGPVQCAGLDIVQYDHEKMCEELPNGLELIESEAYMHITPKESGQEYIYFVIKSLI